MTKTNGDETDRFLQKMREVVAEHGIWGAPRIFTPEAAIDEVHKLRFALGEEVVREAMARRRRSRTS